MEVDFGKGVFSPWSLRTRDWERKSIETDGAEVHLRLLTARQQLCYGKTIRHSKGESECSPHAILLEPSATVYEVLPSDLTVPH